MANIQFVDINDEPIGGGTKEEAHERGIRRRVIRIFLVNSNSEVLLQRRGDNVLSARGNGMTLSQAM
jgi:isopentenyldiphosphate isomerase